MAGYTRQSSFADGDTITAALFNNEYNQLVNAFNNSTGHSHDGTAASGPVIGLIGDAGETSPNNKVLIDTTNNFIEFYVEVSSSSVQQLYIADGAIIPVTDSDIDIGTTSLRFKDAFIDSITTTGNVAVGGNLTVTGTTTFNGGTITMGDAATDNVVFGADVDSNIIPDDDNTYDLGSSSQEWKDLYIDGVAYLDAINFNGTAITSTAAELNILDGVTSTAAELNLLDGVTSTTAELNILDGVTSTATELNILDGVTSTTTEINLLDGSTANTVVNSKAVIYGSSGELAGTLSTAAQTNITTVGTLTTLTVDDITINGSTISDGGALSITSGGDFTVDSEDDIILDANGADIRFKDNGTGIGTFSNSSSNFVITSEVQDKDIIFKGNDNGSSITALTLDMSEAGAATFNNKIIATELDISGDVDIDGTLEADAITVNGTSLAETISDTVGAMVTSNTETGVTVTYDDSDNTLDFVIGTLNQDTTGLAATATALATARTIGGTSFDGTANISVALADTATALATARTIHGVSFDGTANIDLSEVIQDTVGAMVSSNTESGITVAYEDSDGTLDFTVGTLNQDTTGNAATATALETARTIHGVSFDGTANIDLSEVVQDTVGAMFSSNTESGITVDYQDSDGTIDLTVGTLNQNTTGSAATLTTARTIGGVSFDGSANITPTTFTTATFSGDVNVDSGVLFVDVSENKIGVNQTSPDVSLDLGSNTDSIHVPVGNTAQRPGSPAAGYFRYNSETQKFEGYTTEWGAIAGGGSGTNMDTNIFAGDGSDTTFTLSTAPDSENNLMVFIDGVFQAQNVYSVSGTTLTFATAPANGRVITVYHSTTTVGGSNNSIATMTGDGSDTTLTLSVAPVHENNVSVYFDGVYQNKDSFSVSGTTLTFGVAPPSGVAVEAITATNTSITTATQLSDADGDTMVQVEESSDEDKIRFDVAGTEEMVMDATGIVINDGSNDRDFRIESNGNTHAIFVDGGNDEIGLFTSAPNGLLHIGDSNAEGDTTNPALQIGGTSTYRMGMYTSSEGAVIENKNGDDGIQFRVKTAGEAMRIDGGTGNVGIGNTSPSFKLEVTGNVKLGSTGAIETATNALKASATGDNGFLLRSAVSSAANPSYSNVDDTNTGMFLPGSDVIGLTTGGTERMRIDASGNLSLGTTSHLNLSGSTTEFTIGTTGDTVNDGGGISFAHNTSTLNSYILGQKQSLGIATYGATPLILITNNTERMRIDSDGKLLIGVTSFGNSGGGTEIRAGLMKSSADATSTHTHNFFTNANGAVGSIQTNGSATQFNTSSDARLKDITGKARGLEVINKLNPVAYNWKADGKADEGLIAQEVKELVPNAVSQNEEDVYYQMDYSKLVTPLIKAIQEQQTQIDALQSEINELKNS